MFVTDAAVQWTQVYDRPEQAVTAFRNAEKSAHKARRIIKNLHNRFFL
jgi:hypothetical protein